MYKKLIAFAFVLFLTACATGESIPHNFASGHCHCSHCADCQCENCDCAEHQQEPCEICRESEKASAEAFRG